MEAKSYLKELGTHCSWAKGYMAFLPSPWALSRSWFKFCLQVGLGMASCLLLEHRFGLGHNGDRNKSLLVPPTP